MGALLSLLTSILTDRGKDIKGEREKVVIVGASFAGLAALRLLEKQGGSRVDLTVVEPKDYFEFTPGVLRCLVEPEHAHRLLVPLKRTMGKRTRWVRAMLIKIELGKVFLRDAGGKEWSEPYKHLILATGSNYIAPIKPSVTSDDIHLTHRVASLAEGAKQIETAEGVCVLGGGAVGVELAAEIAARWPGKCVTIVSRSDALLPGFDERAREVAKRWLVSRGVQLFLGDELVDLKPKDGVIRTKNGKTAKASLVLRCTGLTSSTTSYIHPELHISIASNGWLSVDAHMRVVGDGVCADNERGVVLAAGDVANVSAEDKMAFTAELHGEHAAMYVLSVIKGRGNGGGRCVNEKAAEAPTVTTDSAQTQRGAQHAHTDMVTEGEGSVGDAHAHPSTTTTHAAPLPPFPTSVVQSSVLPFLYCVSLGPYDGLLVFNGLVLCGGVGGKVAAFAKAFIEATKLWEAQRVALWVWFWAHVAHPLTFWLHRHVLKRAA